MYCLTLFAASPVNLLTFQSSNDKMKVFVIGGTTVLPAGDERQLPEVINHERIGV